ncbi:MAG: hypothetical protein ACKVPJ_08010 [Chitinophagales bacterium]
MKKVKNFLPAFLILLSSIASAQKNIDVTEHNTTMSLGGRNGFSVALENISKKELKNRFDEFMQQYGKKIELTEVTKTEYMINDVIVSSISETPIDIYLLFEEGKKETIVTGFFDMGDQFISSAVQPVKYKDAENFMRRFAWRIEKLKIQETLSEAEKQLGKRQDEQKDLEKKNASLNEDIKECNETIEKAKNDLNQNAKDQEAKKKEINEQQKSVENVKLELKNYQDY